MFENISELYDSFAVSELLVRCERKYRVGKEMFFCVFTKTESGKDVLSAANPLFCRLIGDKHLCGRAAEEFLPRESCAYLNSLYKLGDGKNKACRFVAEGRNGNVFLVEGVFVRGRAAFTGERIKDPARFFSENELFFPYEKDSYYLGAVSVAENCDRLIITSCSERITEEMAGFASGNDVREAFGQYGCGGIISEIIRESFGRNKPAILYELLGDGLPPVRICVHPMLSKDGNTATLTLERREPVCGKVCDLAYCEIRSTPTGRYIIADMNDTMSELLKSGRVSLSDICSGGHSEKRAKTMDITYRSIKCSPNSPNGETSYIVTINLVPRAVEFRKLSSRENHALYLAAKGNPNKYIAHVMSITEGTVKKMLHDGYRKLGISSRVELVKLYEEKLRSEKTPGTF